MGQVVEHLPSKYETLSSTPILPKKPKNKPKPPLPETIIKRKGFL
jgi:hypothetical protein